MQFYLIIYSSITPANSVKRFFEEEQGFIITLLHTPLSISKGGCSYCLKVRKPMVKQVLEVSEQLHAEVKGVYEEIKPGVYEKVIPNKYKEVMK